MYLTNNFNYRVQACFQLVCGASLPPGGDGRGRVLSCVLQSSSSWWLVPPRMARQAWWRLSRPQANAYAYISHIVWRLVRWCHGRALEPHPIPRPWRACCCARCQIWTTHRCATVADYMPPCALQRLVCRSPCALRARGVVHPSCPFDAAAVRPLRAHQPTRVHPPRCRGLFRPFRGRKSPWWERASVGWSTRSAGLCLWQSCARHTRPTRTPLSRSRYPTRCGATNS